MHRDRPIRLFTLCLLGEKKQLTSTILRIRPLRVFAPYCCICWNDIFQNVWGIQCFQNEKNKTKLNDLPSAEKTLRHYRYWLWEHFVFVSPCESFKSTLQPIRFSSAVKTNLLSELPSREKASVIQRKFTEDLAFDSICERREPLRVVADENAKLLTKSVTTSYRFSWHFVMFFFQVSWVFCALWTLRPIRDNQLWAEQWPDQQTGHNQKKHTHTHINRITR